MRQNMVGLTGECRKEVPFAVATARGYDENPPAVIRTLARLDGI